MAIDSFQKKDLELQISETYTKSSKWVTVARDIMILMILLTVVNVLLKLSSSNSYYLSSVFLSYVLFGTALYIKEFFILPCVSLLIFAIYILAYIFSKKKKAWLLVSLLLVIFDTVFTIIFVMLAMMSGVPLELGLVLEILLHIGAVVFMSIGLAKSGEYYKSINKPEDLPPINEQRADL